MLLRLMFVLVTVSVVVIGMAGCGPDPAIDTPTTAALPPRPWVIAHRGAAAYAPENTIPAFLVAADQGVTFVELDLQRTKDGQLIALHDLTLDRTTDVSAVFPDRSRPDPGDEEGAAHWWLDDFTFDELRRLDAGTWFDEKFAGTRIATFDEILDAVRGRTGVFIELKSPERYPGIEREMMAVLARHGLDIPGADPRTPIMLQSFTVSSIERLAAMGTTLPVHVLFDADDADVWLSEDGLAKAQAMASGISPEIATLESHPAGWARARQLGLPITPWTFRASTVTGFATVTEEMAHAIASGADGVITDNPDLAPAR